MMSFLQSQQWEELQRAIGRKVWRVGETLVIKHDLPLKKNYLYCPRGPIGPIGFFLEEIKKIAKEEKSIFLKIEPNLGFDRDYQGLKKSSKEIQPSKTIILDILKSEEELLSQMHSKTRYNIRLAQKKGIAIEESSQGMNDFLKLLKKTAQRDKFYLHPNNYYLKMMEVLGKEGIVKLFLAKHQGKIIAANLICFFNQTATYLHGASDYGCRQLMAPYLLKWQEILKAKELGLKYYDFNGINEKKWPGVTRFKKGFGGKEIDYPGAFDIVYSLFWYKAYNLARKIF